MFLAVAVPGLIVIIHAAFSKFSELIIERQTYSLIISCCVFPAVFALFLGALSFNRKFINSTKEFLADTPGNAGRIFWVRFFPGLILLLLPLHVVYFLVSPHGLILALLFSFSTIAVFLSLSYIAWQNVITENVFPLKKVAIVAISVLAFSFTAHAFANLRPDINWAELSGMRGMKASC